ncbi:MAG: hypothetical protein HY270_20155 [Deltaproteobacteria bacterium]|nr:hypothetical protein [Deltaproteobacteria bacterium]
MRAATVLLLTSAIATIAASNPLYANSGGITTFSGKSGPLVICNVCHTGGVAPAVGFSGPASLNSGDTGTFTFTVISSNPDLQTASGVNIAASAGTLAVSGSGTKLVGSGATAEIVHSAPRANDGNGQVDWTFKWKAPAAAGNYILYGAGNSVDRSNTVNGDAAAAAVWFVAVGSVTPLPTYTTTAPPMSPSATVSLSTTPTSTVTSSPTTSAIPAATATVTPSPTTPPTPSLTSQPSETVLPSPTPTQSLLPQATATATVTSPPEPTASASPSATPSRSPLPSFSPASTPTPAQNGDANCDAVVSAADLTAVASSIGQAPICGNDLNGDGLVTVEDALQMESLLFGDVP